MKRFPKILVATCAALALTSSLALAADAVSSTSAAATGAQTGAFQNCPAVGAAGGMGMTGGRMGGGHMGAGYMNGGHMLGANGQSGHMRGVGYHMAQADSK